jgi:hypothetical protein
LLGDVSVSTFPRQVIEAVTDELFEMMIYEYIRFDSKLVQFRRFQSQVIPRSSFVTVEEKALVVQ